MERRRTLARGLGGKANLNLTFPARRDLAAAVIGLREIAANLNTRNFNRADSGGKRHRLRWTGRPGGLAGERQLGRRNREGHGPQPGQRYPVRTSRRTISNGKSPVLGSHGGGRERDLDCTASP